MKKSEVIMGTQLNQYHLKKSMLQRMGTHLKNYYQLYLLTLPAIVVVFVFNYIPMYGVQLAFREFDPLKGITGGDYVGLKYFIKFLNSFQFKEIMTNTLSISLYTIVIGFPIPILLALLFNQIRNKKGKKFIQTIAYMPHFISVIVLVGMLSIFLSPSAGIAGSIFRMLGLEPINLMGEPKYFRAIYVLSDVWQHAGWNSIIYIAALAGLDTQLYDAADVDGANKWQKIWYIDIPSLVPTMIILLILNMGSVMSVGFEKAFLMQNNLNLPVSEIISTYTYKIGILSNQFSYSSAIGLFNTFINFILLVIVNTVSRKVNNVSLW